MTTPPAPTDRRRLDREIFALALPAFATLVAEPMLLMADTAIVGHLSTESLAGLGIATSLLSLLIGLCIFLAYATTGLVARLIGAGDTPGALARGLDGITLGLGLGIVLAIALAALAPVAVARYGVAPEVAEQAVRYLRIVCIGLPGVLVMLAATGVLRGLQDTRTPLYVAVGMNVVNIALNLTLVFGLGLGIGGAAAGTAASQLVAGSVLATVVLVKARRLEVRWRWHPAGVLLAARTGGWLVLRTATLQVAIVLTTLTAARLGSTGLAGHQVLNSLWSLLAFALDAIAIAAQAIIGRQLGTGDGTPVGGLMRRMVFWGVVLGLVFGVLLWASSPLWVGVFSPDPGVQQLVLRILGVIAVLAPIAGVVYVLDGVLIGAGDARYLALAGVVNLVVYLPLVLLVWTTGAGLIWLWLAYGGFMLARLVTLGLRARGSRWQRLGAL